MKFTNLRYLFVLNLLNQNLDKQKFLQEKLASSNDVDFSYRKKQNYFYRFYKREGNLVIGKIVKKGQTPAITNRETLEEERLESYQQIYVIFNVSNSVENDVNAQTCYVEYREDFCSDCLALVKDFFQKIGKESDVDIEVNPISKDENEFWAFIQTHKIKSLALEIQPPNIFNHKLPLMEEAKYAQEKFKAQKIKKSMDTEEDGGLDLISNKSLLEEDVKHCLNGGGIIKASSGKGQASYNSKDGKNIKITIVTIPAELAKDNDNFFSELFKFFK